MASTVTGIESKFVFLNSTNANTANAEKQIEAPNIIFFNIFREIC